jgi:4-diphosphocytidyl-2-C-methyl-D-erythritol kinase
VGEQLTAVTVPRVPLVLAHPGVGVSTAEAFSHPDLVRDMAPTPNALLNWSYGENSIQSVSEKIQPQAKSLRGNMINSCNSARMSGSGSAYFARTSDFRAANDAATELRALGYHAWALHSSELHPLQSFVKHC